MKAVHTITLVIVSDDHYAILAAALLKSIEVNLHPDWHLDAWIVSDDISEQGRQKLQASINNDVTTINWQNARDIIPAGIFLPKDLSSYPLNIYLRLFIPHFIPASVEKVLYLDADMIAVADISPLWKTDISRHTVAAVTDQRLKTFDNHWGGIKNYRQLGFEATSPYFNTGLLLINTRRWREQNTTERIIDIINKHKRFANYPDQYGMNIALHNDWLPLDARWNHMVTEPCADPFILHFVERKPIYTTYKNGIDKLEIFNRYLNLTAWRGTHPVREGTRYLKKINNILGKFRNRQ